MKQELPELDQLLAGLCDDELSDAQRARLAELLQEDSAARARYLEWVDLHACLALEMENRVALTTADALAGGASSPETTPITMRRSDRISRTLMRSVLAASLVIAVGIVAAVWVGRDGGQTSVAQVMPLGEITDAEDLQWTDASLATAVGGKIFAGPHQLQTGQVQLRLVNGVTITLHAPAQVTLVDAKSVQLSAGRLVARVPEDGIGFRVTTPNTDVVDLGTEFGVSVEDNGSTEIHVAEGVVVARSASSSGVVPILRHEAGRVDSDLREVSPIPYDSSRFPGLARRENGATLPAAESLEPLPLDSRIVFLGDEAVSQETGLLLLSQALSGAGFEQKPRLYNSGLTFELFFDEENYQRYVARFKPTHAFVVFGSEISRFSNQYLVTPEAFRKAIVRMVDRLEQDGVQPIIATGYPLSPEHAAGQRRLDEYNRFLRKLARQRGYRLADLEAAFREAAAQRLDLIARNGFEPTFEGNRQIARAWLAAMGWPEVHVPDTLDLEPMPGIVPVWKVYGWPKERPLDAEAVAALEPDETWQTVHLPQPIDRYSKRFPHPSHSNIARDRLRGFATHLVRLNLERTVAVGMLHSANERDAVLNVGGTLHSVWLNGERVFDPEHAAIRGRHVGFERLPIHLQAGENTIVVEARVSFFISVTDSYDWPLP